MISEGTAIPSQWSRLKERLGHKTLVKSTEHEHLAFADIGNPTDMICGWVQRNSGRGLIAYGESNHHGEGILQQEIQLLTELQARFGISMVFLEEDENQMPHVRQYYETGIMPKDLEEYLVSGFVRKDSQPHTYKLELVRICKELGVPVEFIDTNNLFLSRDIDWANKIQNKIGPSINGLYVLIAGENHVLHTPLYYQDPRPVALNLIDQHYPQATLSICSINIDPRHPPPPEQILESSLARDLARLDLADQPTGIWTSQSPFNGKRESTWNGTIVSDAFDIVMASPGRNLSRP